MMVFQTFHFYGPRPEQDLREAASPPGASLTEGAWFALGAAEEALPRQQQLWQQRVKLKSPWVLLSLLW